MFRVWAGETTKHPHDVMERALAHTIQNKAQATHDRTDLLDKRRVLMNDWAKFINTKPKTKGLLLRLRREASHLFEPRISPVSQTSPTQWPSSVSQRPDPPNAPTQRRLCRCRAGRFCLQPRVDAGKVIEDLSEYRRGQTDSPFPRPQAHRAGQDFQ
jgi:hypothetical protein